MLPILLLVGPTASGKSAAALALAERFGGEIISIDSALVYRDMDIGTAKPSADERARVPHHLIDLISPEESYSVARFVRDCVAAIDAVQARGRLPLLVGGTLLYAHALTQGLSDVPPTDPAVRAAVAAERARDGIAALHARLQQVDPTLAARLAPGDTQRIERALEVYRQTGRPLSSFQGQRQPALAGRRYAVLRWLPQARDWLHARCAERLEAMFAAGLVDEVRGLLARYRLHPELPAMRCVGYRQVLDVLQGRAPASELQARALYATRQLAKRQLTWLRSFEGDPLACDAPDALAQATRWVEQQLQAAA